MYLLHVMPPTALKEPERLGDFPPLESVIHAPTETDFQPPLKMEAPLTKLYLYERNTPRMIVDVARDRSVELICMAATSQRVDVTWWSAGKTVERVIAEAPCSVLCARGRAVRENDWKRPSFKRVLLLIELGEQQEAVLSRLMPLVKRFRSELDIFPVTKSRRMEQNETSAREFCRAQSVTATVLQFDNPKNRMQNLLAILDKTPVDLIVMTPRTREKFSSRLVSDVLVRLLRLAKCPVLLLR